MHALHLIRLMVTAATVWCVCAATAAAQDRDAFLAGHTINCHGCDLGGAKLDRRDLTGADLSGANLRGARLLLATLTDTKLDGADLAGTIMPDGTEHP